MTRAELHVDPHQVLRDQFGLSEFRGGQRDVIDRILAGKNTAAVFPTGGGKSLCYQLPSQMLPGTTVVVSPLIALMKDQCDALRGKGIAAARLDSTLSDAEFRDAVRGIRSGSIRLFYVAPERFFNERFLATLGGIDIDLFAIDEAHCISQWGHNFRPDYLKLAELVSRLGAKRMLALTATATPQVLDDICDAFAIAPEDAIRTPFHRSNLILKSHVVAKEHQFDSLYQRIEQRPRGATLVYVSKQKTAEQVAEQLTQLGITATAYHAGLDAETRESIQLAFSASPDAVIVATIAFGMGIDKADIRYVYHFNPPKSLEAYAQEVGRAGRDGRRSICEMLLASEDRTVLENFTYGDTPSRQSIGQFVDLIDGQPDEFFLSHYKISYETDIRILVVRTLLTYLELDGFIQSTAPRYDTYQIHPLVTSRAILSNFDGERREFLSSVLGQLTKGRKWFYLDVVAATKSLNQPRSRIVKAVDFMAAQGWITLKVSDLVHGYRHHRSIESAKLLADEYHQRMAQRESSEVARLDDVFRLAQATECQSAMLARHFGETFESSCGECSFCRGDGPHEIPSVPVGTIGDSVQRSLDEVCREYPDHFSSPRQRARFLCGLSSPKMQRARLTRHASFGVCEHIPFAEVLKQVV